jgi:hypothetical protein
MDRFIPSEAKLEQPGGVDFNAEQGFLLVQLDKDSYGLPDQEVMYQSRPFTPKDELHITIVSNKAAEALKSYLDQNNPERIHELINETHWSYRRLPLFYHVRDEDGAETIIQMVKMPELAQFYRQLSRMLGYELEPPPAHVTLFTRETEKGIGIPDQGTFERLVQAEVQPEQVFFQPGAAG